jgi:hypothetical protein
MNAPTLTVYDGRIALGSVIERGERWEAITAAGKSLGLYNTQQAAVNAIGYEANLGCDAEAS